MVTTVYELWQQVLLRLQIRMSKPTFETWLRPARPVMLTETMLILAVPDALHREWIEDHYASLIEQTLQEVTHTPLQIAVTIARPEDLPHPTNATVLEAAPVNEVAAAIDDQPFPTPDLNPRYTFQSFVVGASNRFAHAAALAVAEAPSQAYNPLFIYGGVGLGKTHLMQAIGHRVLERQPGARVVYISSEKFTNEFINAIRDNTTAAFRSRYRNADVLLIDDIQFLAGKEQTQEEFFHTFNALHEANRQIVVSSDRPPKEIPTLEDRLRSRFEWGLITDIQPPDFETRTAILRKKARAERLEVPEEVLSYIASHIDTNIRELEGALIRVIAYASLTVRTIDLQLAEEALKEILQPQNGPVTPQQIQRAVADYFHLDIAEMKAKHRSQRVALPRQIAMFLCRELTDLSLPRIGQLFGGRDHTTVLHACNKIATLRERDPSLRETLAAITQLVHKM